MAVKAEEETVAIHFMILFRIVLVGRKKTTNIFSQCSLRGTGSRSTYMARTILKLSSHHWLWLMDITVYAL
jgi:hypothetical protein